MTQSRPPRLRKIIPLHSSAPQSSAASHFSTAPNSLIGLAASLANLFSSLEILSSDPHNGTLCHGIVRNAQEIAAQFNTAALRLNNLKSGLPSGHVGCRALADLQTGVDASAARLIAQVNAVYRSNTEDGGSPGDFFLGQNASDISVNTMFVQDPAAFRPLAAAKVRANKTVVRSLARLGRARPAMAQLLVADPSAANRGLNLPQYVEACAASDKMHTALNEMRPM